jgi:caffeoyl-CoA O-methyltransferase
VAIVDPAIEAYLRDLQPSPDLVLQKMRLEGERRGFPIINLLVGRLCEQLARSIGAKRVFELGSGFGYSTYWFGRAVGPRGKVVHTENDAGLSAEAKAWLTKGKLARRVEFRLGDAVDLLKADRRLNDVVFIDIDKEGYPAAWDVARTRVRVGGLIVTDNTLWQGKVVLKAKDEATAAVQEYNHRAFSDPRFLSTLMPVRDGVTVSLRVR